jgi:FlaA1/EpsC-like NDP-sugar epimerase
MRFVFKINHQIWRYISLNEAKIIFFSDSIGSIAMLLLSLYFKLAVGIIILDWLLNVFAHISVRVARRFRAQDRRINLTTQSHQNRLLVVGAGEAGILYAKQIKKQDILVGFIDDDIYKLNQYINGTRVLGTTKQIRYIVKEYAIDEVIICIPSGSKQFIKSVIDSLQAINIRLRSIPSLGEILKNSNNIKQTKEIQIEDLLDRQEYSFNISENSHFITNQTILVAGAGGSIGSELSLQIARCRPKALLLLDHDEFNIYNIERTLREKFTDLKIVALIGDIRNEKRMEYIIKEFQPDIYFHAAAYKHVPLMEANIAEAITTNIFGTKNLARIASQYQCKKFLLISSDKAVQPTSVMGTTKRIAEMIIQNISSKSHTKFMSVRFGNVLSSRGSVIPLFKEQIENGGPITITHPDMIRYFMTISEAVSLVLEATMIGQGGERFVLDMGEPIKITDLVNDLIRLSGFRINDIPIKYIGLRPGEKIFEEPLSIQEKSRSTTIERIFIGKNDYLPKGFDDKLKLLENLDNKSNYEIKQLLKSLVKGYSFSK